MSDEIQHFLFLFSDSEKYYTVDGKIPEGKLRDELSDMYKTKDGYVRLHTNFAQFVHPSFDFQKKYTHLFLVTNKVYSTSCSANQQERPSRPRLLSGLQKSLKQRCSDGTSAPLRCARTT